MYLSMQTLQSVHFYPYHDCELNYEPCYCNQTLQTLGLVLLLRAQNNNVDMFHVLLKNNIAHMS